MSRRRGCRLFAALAAVFAAREGKEAKKLRERLAFGNEAEGDFEFLGRWISQDRNTYSIEVNQDVFIQKLKPIYVSRARRRESEKRCG